MVYVSFCAADPMSLLGRYKIEGKAAWGRGDTEKATEYMMKTKKKKRRKIVYASLYCADEV